MGRLGRRTHGTQTDSLVAAQPMSDEETLRGATNRAHAVLAAHPDVDYGAHA